MSNLGRFDEKSHQLFKHYAVMPVYITDSVGASVWGKALSQPLPHAISQEMNTRQSPGEEPRSLSHPHTTGTHWHFLCQCEEYTGLHLFSCSTVSVAMSPNTVSLLETWHLAQTSCLGLGRGEIIERLPRSLSLSPSISLFKWQTQSLTPSI